MTIPRFIAIILIFVGACLAWAMLGSALTYRATNFSSRLHSEVVQNWGAPMIQGHPEVYYETTGGIAARRHVLPERSDVEVDLHYDKKKKGLFWHRTYTATFRARYQITNPTPIAQTVYVGFKFPCEGTRYDQFTFTIGDRESAQDPSQSCGLTESVRLEAGESVPVTITYRAGGVDHWLYSFGNHARVRQFTLALTTNFHDINIPLGAQSPTEREQTEDGWRLQWAYTDVIHAQGAVGSDKGAIGMDMPKVLNPGPVAARMAFFAPVSLLFYFTVLIIMATLREVRLHPVNYFFLAAGCFAFQLLFAYTVDLMAIHWAFLVAAGVSTLLVSGYLWRAVDAAFARLSFAAQLGFMILFSYSFFFDGLTGITIAVGAVVTLAILMTVTAKVDWSTKFRLPSRKASLPQT